MFSPRMLKASVNPTDEFARKFDESELGDWGEILHPHTDRMARLDGTNVPRSIRTAEQVPDLLGEATVDLGAPPVLSRSAAEYSAQLMTRASDAVYANATALAAIEGLWRELRPEIGYLGEEEVKRVEFGLKVAYCAHDGQKRKSGEPFIIHPVAVAGLLAGLRMDADAVIAGLLHDTVEDTDLTFLQVEVLFGSTVRRIVEGETKVSKLPKLALGARQAGSSATAVGPSVGGHPMDEQAENLRQMFIAMSEDFRIIIVKLADRLHNMRTLEHMPPHKQQSISRETLDIFAPLAHRLGIWQFKSELEDTAFKYLYPEQHARIKALLGKVERKYVEGLDGSRNELESILSMDSMLTEQEVEVTVTGRMKELYPLWVKMEAKASSSRNSHRHGSTSELPADVLALRVVLDLAQRPGEDVNAWKTRGVWLCYHVLGLVQHLPDSRPVPSQVKDYISFPKPNGYQSLHTSIIRKGQTMEVQIRTNWMHSIAECGMAAHWLYKDDRYGSGGSAKLFNKYQVAWMETIKEWQDEIHNSTEFVDAIRRELLGKRVFVFLRNGRILNLSRGATVIDAAFAIHTEVGLKMIGAQINGRNMPLSYELQNGDVVSITTCPEGRPSLDWMRFARSRSTRAKLRGYFRSQQREAMVQKGWILVSDFLAQHKDLVTKRHGKTPSQQEITQLMAANSMNPEDFCVGLTTMKHAVRAATLAQLLKLRFDEVEVSARASTSCAEGVLPDGWAAWQKMANESAKAWQADPGLTEAPSSPSPTPVPAPSGVPGGVSESTVPCPKCMPVPGESVVYMATAVHRPSCPMVHSENKPVLPVRLWNTFVGAAGEGACEVHPVELQVLCVDRRFLLRDVSDVVAAGGEIVKTSSQTIANSVAVLTYKVMVSDHKQLQGLISEILKVPDVTSCERIVED
eukprot:CAMPEP_0172583616 /NCGR_PEP_ID=MMETSP1068-20121228/3219_1 /TAXON_ID=35684 /ORGANISM="Pseudopedinella elastica, Strain CCMP716" /LENGTH=913 /DNA_ID=CAMNT_0013377481 /DNA_START=220 /DNA_END=2961 /DNA_ORIENTATION=+